MGWRDALDSEVLAVEMHASDLQDQREKVGYGGVDPWSSLAS